jgi:hypothetical protein
MRLLDSVLLGSLSVTAVVSCQRSTDQNPSSPTLATAASAASAVSSAAGPTDASKEESAPSSKSASAYPMCGGQRVVNVFGISRSGPVSVQLAPAFLDQMPLCGPEEAFPKDRTLEATKGSINAKGDCELASIGVTCHYHSGSEFVSSTASKQTPAQGELHCLFPSDDAKSPKVYGAHIVCRDKALGTVHGHVPHDVHQGAACAPSLVQRLGQCRSFRCCDDGTLTNPIADLARDGRNDVRPDFRICENTIEIDCGELSNLTAHDANSPALGGVGEPAFAVASPETGKDGSRKAKAGATNVNKNKPEPKPRR